MKLAITIISSVLSLVGLVLMIAHIRNLALRSIYIETKTKRKLQNDVFGWGYKIVCTVEEEYRNSDLDKKTKSRKKFDQAVSRLNDVLMINGIDPKLWNINGIITYAVHTLHNKKGEKGVD